MNELMIITITITTNSGDRIFRQKRGESGFFQMALNCRC